MNMCNDSVASVKRFLKNLSAAQVPGSESVEAKGVHNKGLEDRERLFCMWGVVMSRGVAP